MEISKVLKRSWQILWAYKALWIFGMILALTTASFSQGSSSWSGNDNQGSQSSDFQFDKNQPWYPQFRDEFDREFQREMDQSNWQWTEDFNLDWDLNDLDFADFLNLIIVLVSIGIVLNILFTFLRYIAETASIKMVNDYEDSGEKMKVGDGFRLGWSQTSWRLFLIELTLNIPVAIVFLGLLALAFAPIYPMLFETGGENVLAIVTAIAIIFIDILFAFLAGSLLLWLKPIVRRECVLNDAGVFDAIRQGFTLVRRNLKDTGLMWLIMIGIDLVWKVAIVPVAFILLPIGVLFGIAVGGLFSASSVFQFFLIGIPVFVVIMVLPLTFLGGLREVFQSSAWTLTYREIITLNKLANGQDELPAEAEAA